MKKSNKLTISKQMILLAEEIIEQHGLGFEVTNQEIQEALNKKFGTKKSSILPADFCYNKWNKGFIQMSTQYPMLFEYVSDGRYRVFGENYLYNGEVFARPIGTNKNQVVGYCTNGKRAVFKLEIYSDKLSDNAVEYVTENKTTILTNSYVNSLAEAWYDTEQNIEIERALNEGSAIKRYADTPVTKSEKIQIPSGVTYKRDKDKAIQALQDAKFCCEFDITHESFIRKCGKYRYTESHHLIPMKAQDDFEKTLDTPANIVSLCSNCHNLLHYGAEFENVLEKLYEERATRLKNVELEISFEELKKYY